MTTEVLSRAGTDGVDERQRLPGHLARLGHAIERWLCSLHGHDPLLHFDERRMYLRCASCGYETPGWELDQRRPRIRFYGK